MRRTVAQTAALMAIFTLISKCLGFFREMVMANFFGTSYVTDAYVMANAIPSIAFAGLFSAVATAYMPIYSDKVENKGELEANKLTSDVMTILIIISLFSAIIGIIFSDQIVTIFASGFHGKTAELTSFFIKITFAYAIFTSVTSLLETMLQYKGVFLPQILIGYLQNAIVIILFIISAYYNHYYLAFGWLIANIVRLILMAKLSQKQGLKFIRSEHMHSTIKLIMPLAIPVFIGTSISQIGVFVDKTLASGLPEGSVSALNYANLIVGMITGLTVAVLTTITYPRFAQANSLANSNLFNDILSKGINLVVIITVPCTLGGIAYSDQIIKIVYERGAFDSSATSYTSSAFVCYMIGIVFAAISILFIQVFYSNHNTRTPVIMGAVAMMVDITLNFILVKPLGHNGLALSTSIGSIVQNILLYWGIRKYFPNIKVVSSKKVLVNIILAAFIAVFSSVLTYKILMNVFERSGSALFIVAVAGAAVVYLLLLKAFRIEEVKILRELIKWKR